VLSECFSSITDKNGRSFVDNIDFIVLAHLLITAFVPAYTAYEPVYKQKLNALSTLLTNKTISEAYLKLGGKIGTTADTEDEDEFEADTSRPDATAEEKDTSNKIIKAFSSFITILTDPKSEFTAKLLVLVGSKRSLDALLKTAKTTDPAYAKVRAKTIYELAFKLFNQIKVEHLIMQKLAPKLIDLQKALDTMPKFIDKTTFENMQNNVIDRIEAEEEEEEEDAL
jgi:hypothetical protein